MAVPGWAASLNRRPRIWGSVAAALLVAACASAADRPGGFDYWILSLSWSPQFCNNRYYNEQCVQPRGLAVHGLWPQNERGYPEYCTTREDVPDATVERMMPIMPGKSLVQKQWRKHGACSGMSVSDYFLNVERAWRRIVVPQLLGEVPNEIQTTRQQVEQAFIRVNPDLEADGIALQCSGPWLREIRICLNREFGLRACGADVADSCKDRIVIRPTGH